MPLVKEIISLDHSGCKYPFTGAGFRGFEHNSRMLIRHYHLYKF
jgi:hypothetical protein